MLMIPLSSLSEIRHLICDNSCIWFLNVNLIYKTIWTWVGSGFLISTLGKPNWFCLTSLITLVLLIWKWISLFLKKKYLFAVVDILFMIGLELVHISIVRIAYKKSGALILSMKFLSPDIAFYLYKSTTPLLGILLSCLGWCYYLLLRIII